MNPPGTGKTDYAWHICSDGFPDENDGGLKWSVCFLSLLTFFRLWRQTHSDHCISIIKSHKEGVWKAKTKTYLSPPSKIGAKSVFGRSRLFFSQQGDGWRSSPWAFTHHSLLIIDIWDQQRSSSHSLHFCSYFTSLHLIWALFAFSLVCSLVLGLPCSQRDMALASGTGMGCYCSMMGCGRLQSMSS